MKKGMEGKGSFPLFHHIPFIHNQILLHPSQACRASILIHSEELQSDRVLMPCLLVGYRRQFQRKLKR